MPPAEPFAFCSAFSLARLSTDPTSQTRNMLTNRRTTCSCSTVWNERRRRAASCWQWICRSKLPLHLQQQCICSQPADGAHLEDWLSGCEEASSSPSSTAGSTTRRLYGCAALGTHVRCAARPLGCAADALSSPSCSADAGVGFLEGCAALEAQVRWTGDRGPRSTGTVTSGSTWRSCRQYSRGEALLGSTSACLRRSSARLCRLRGPSGR